MDQERQYVGIDLHRHRSVIVRRDDEGRTLSCVRVDNVDLGAFSAEITAAAGASTPGGTTAWTSWETARAEGRRTCRSPSS